MTTDTNAHGQPVGALIPGWAQPGPPAHVILAGRSCRVEPLRVADHAASLHAVFTVDGGESGWTYLPYGPFASLAEFEAWLERTCLSDDPLFFAIVDAGSGDAVGMASYLNIRPLHGTVEVGHVHFSRSMQRSRVASEAMYLMMRHAFAAGYRRYEWKCDVLNARSRRAARRFGFSYEGVSRQHMVVRGRSRDSAWFACVDGEWPSLKHAYETWLDDANFDADGNQFQSLASLTRPILIATE